MYWFSVPDEIRANLIEMFSGTDYWSSFSLNTHKGCDIVQTVSLRPLTAEARVRFLVSPFEICGGKSGTGTGFSPSSSVFPCQ
jgi:hypothetical protein